MAAATAALATAWTLTGGTKAEPARGRPARRLVGTFCKSLSKGKPAHEQRVSMRERDAACNKVHVRHATSSYIKHRFCRQASHRPCTRTSLTDCTQRYTNARYTPCPIDEAGAQKDAVLAIRLCHGQLSIALALEVPTQHKVCMAHASKSSQDAPSTSREHYPRGLCTSRGGVRHCCRLQQPLH